MEIKRVVAIYFSPTGGTKKYVTEIAERLSATYESIDLTMTSARIKSYYFSEYDLVVFGSPVYIGRLPQIEGGVFDRIKGDNTPAIFNVSYGNRDFEDALLEEKKICEGNGFFGIAAGAWIAPHTYSNKIAGTRPDLEDINCVETFVDRIKAVLKLNSFSNIELKVSGEEPYREVFEMPYFPEADDKCNECNECVSVCPVEAITISNPKITDKKKCIDCLACVKICKVGARNIFDPKFAEDRERFEAELSLIRKEPELFYLSLIS